MDLKDHQDLRATLETQDRQDLKACPEFPELGVTGETEDLQEMPDFQASQVLQADLVNQETTGLRDKKESGVLQVHQDPRPVQEDATPTMVKTHQTRQVLSSFQVVFCIAFNQND